MKWFWAEEGGGRGMDGQLQMKEGSQSFFKRVSGSGKTRLLYPILLDDNGSIG